MKYIKSITIIIVGVFIGTFGLRWYLQINQFPVPKGETILLQEEFEDDTLVIEEIIIEEIEEAEDPAPKKELQKQPMTSQREIFITDGVKHSIPLDEILSGGPGKDGIPSIDNPSLISREEADNFLNDSDLGIGLTVNGENRFYPYRILVWHEIANDMIQGVPILVTYCPLCATGIVFDRRVDGVVQEFGVSGRLWRSNLLMYNRAGDEKDESLWSQVLGEAVLGIHTGQKLSIVRSDIVRWDSWKGLHPDTKALSQKTGVARNYSRDPYGDYYTSESVSFGASFNDTRLHPKALVHGIEINGSFKAYSDEALKSVTGEINDTFAGKNIRIAGTDAGGVRFEADGEPLPSIPAFWFSWLAVHPNTGLYK